MLDLLTVADILDVPTLKAAGLTLVAGTGGLRRHVRWAHVVEVPEAPAWLRSGDLLLTAGMSFPQEPQERERLMRRLHEMGLAGIIFAPGAYWPAIPDDVRWRADECQRRRTFDPLAPVGN